MKNFYKIGLVVLLLVISVFAFASCGSSVDEISIEDDGMPQLVYVLGQDINLSNGVLTVKSGDSTTQVPMTSEDVSVSGYDKTKLGEQQVTISYGEKSIEITVSVVERVQIVDYVADYLVGDKFDNTVGRLKITRDDGSSYNVILNNTNVTIEGFDSEEAREGLSVKAIYVAGSDRFETTFNVNIHKIDSVNLHKPNKITYYSHEDGIELAGGYLTLTGNGGKLERDIQLNEDMISGFDLKAVNSEKTSLTQIVDVEFDGKKYPFEIKLIYTDISKFNDNVDKFADLDFSETVPEISDELGLLALDMMGLYADLSKAEQTFIDEEAALNVARAAVSWGYAAWLTDLMLFKDAFAYEIDPYTYSYGLYMYCNSYDAVEDAVEGLKVTDRTLYTMGPKLDSIIEIFGEEVSVYIYIPVVDSAVFENMIPIFEHMLEFYDDILPLVPADWKTVGVNAYADEIEAVYSFMVESEYLNSSNAWIYTDASGWRREDEVNTFDALYEYYYAKNDTEALRSIANAALPTVFDSIITYIETAISQISEIQSGYMFNTTGFFYNVSVLNRLADEFRNSNDEMIKSFYETLPINAIFGFDDSAIVTLDDVIDYLYYIDGGYVQLSSSLFGNKVYHALMEKYMKAYEMTLTDKDYATKEEYGVIVEEMMDMFLSLTAAEQNIFLSILMPYYFYDVPAYAFGEIEEDADYVSEFNTIINEYYKSKFADDVRKTAYIDLVVALEIYSRRFDLESWIEEFKSRMKNVNDALELMSEEEKTSFMGYLGEIYTRCAEILTKFENGEPKTDISAWQDKFDALKDAIMIANNAAYTINSGIYDQEGIYFYNIFFCAYERALSIAKDILENAPAEIVYAYYNELLFVMEYEGEEDPVEWTYDYVLTLYRSSYIYYQVNLIGGADIYNEMGLAEFFDKAYDLLAPYFNSIFYEDFEFVVDKNKVLDIMDAFSHLHHEAKIMYLIMEGSFSFYYSSLDEFILSNFSAAAAEVAYKMLDLEYSHIIYMFYGDSESFDELETILGELKTLYGNLDGEDKNSFKDLEEIYTYYIELCDELIREVEDADPAA